MESVECPPTPTDVLNIPCSPKSPQTPAVVDSKAVPVTSKSPKSPSPGRESPEPNCAICLSKLQNKSFTDSCFHQFCFTCLSEWSKVKAECPLCKQSFKSIIYNVRSNEDYDQYHLRPTVEPADYRAYEPGQRFRYRSTLTSDRRRELTFEAIIYDQTLRYDAIPNQPLDLRASWSRRRRAATSDFRRQVYEDDLWARPLSDITGRFRDASPVFYRANPAMVHRLVPFLNRELNVLLENCAHQVAFVLELITNLVSRYDIRSREVYEHLQPYFGSRTKHFIHEFYEFARSNYDFVGYDQHVVYQPNPGSEIVIEDIPTSPSSSADSDDDVVFVCEEPAVQSQPRCTTPQTHSDHTYGVDASSSRVAEEVESASSSGSDIKGKRFRTQRRRRRLVSDTSSDSDYEMVPEPSTSKAAQAKSESLEENKNEGDTVKKKTSGGSDEDCVIVGFVKPLHERTPEIITLSSAEEAEKCSDNEVKRKNSSWFCSAPTEQLKRMYADSDSTLLSSSPTWSPWFSSSSSSSSDKASDWEENIKRSHKGKQMLKRVKPKQSVKENADKRVKHQSSSHKKAAKPVSKRHKEDDKSWSKRKGKCHRSHERSSSHSVERERHRDKRHLRKKSSYSASFFPPPYSGAEIVSFIDGARPRITIRSVVSHPVRQSVFNQPGPSTSSYASSQSSSHSHKKRSSSHSSSSSLFREHHERAHRHKAKKKKHKRGHRSDSEERMKHKCGKKLKTKR